ncbi:MAG TPA: SAF domain-containing protein [Acidimicrobiales bacterium]|nr:SAF domain-containing protein [Acidimicrobiales bacterium]
MPRAPRRRSPRHRPGLLTRLRRARRRPAARWALALAAAVAAGAVTHLALSDVRAQLAAIEEAPVVVATRAVAPGAPLGPADVAVARWPAALVPDGALTDPPLGRAPTVALARGEPVLTSRLAPQGVAGTAARLPAGTRAVGVPLAPHAVVLEPGDRVDVLAAVDPGLAGTAPAVVLTAAAVVVDVGDGRATVAVPVDVVGRVTAALAHGVVDLALTPGVVSDAPAGS